MRNHRVLLVTGVVAAYRVPLYARLARLPGWKLRVLHGKSTGEAGVSVVDRVETLPFDRRLVANLERHLGPFTIRWQRGALQAARAFDPQVLIISGEVGTLSTWMLCLWAKLTERHVIVWTSAWEGQPRGSLSFRVKRAVLRIFVQLPDMFLAYSSRGMDALVGLGVHRDRVVVCPNGLSVDAQISHEVEIRAAAAKLRQDEGVVDRPVFLFVGRMTKGKAVDLLIDAFARSSSRGDSVLWLVGDGPELSNLQGKVAAAKVVNVKFWGRITEGIDTMFASADCFVLPGLGGLALNQAMVFGVPCICGEADGTEEDLVTDAVTGFRVAPGDVGALSAALERAAAMRETGMLSEIGKAARERLLSTSTAQHMAAIFDDAVRAAEADNPICPG